MNRIASIDIGTNSVLYSLLQVRGSRSVTEIYFERHSPRIGSRLAGRKKPLITDAAYTNLRKILHRLVRHATAGGAEEILIAATNPLRLARNGRMIRRRLETDLGRRVIILTPDREAYLSFIAATGRLAGHQAAVVIDMGGGSTELVVYRGRQCQAFVSLPEGAVSLTEKFGSAGRVKPEQYSRLEAYLSRYEKKAAIVRPYLNNPVSLVGGTSTALAYLKDRDILGRRRGVVLTREELDEFVHLLGGLSLRSRRQLLAIDKKRAEIIFAGAFWFNYLFKILDIKKARATPWGLRHGMVLDFLERGIFTA